MPNMAKYAKYGSWGTYLGAPNMVKWGVPEKILQNAVQTRWSLVNRTLQSKVMTKSHFWLISPCILPCKIGKQRYLNQTPLLSFAYLFKCNMKFGSYKKKLNLTGLL